MQSLPGALIEKLESYAIPISLSDPMAADCPLIYVNRQFQKLTGYKSREILGTNCRFLQGEDTDPDAIVRVRKAVKDQSHIEICLKNYRKDGTAFDNLLIIAPVTRSADRTLLIGCQYDITRQATNRRLDRQITEVDSVQHEIRQTLGEAAELIVTLRGTRSASIRALVDHYFVKEQIEAGSRLSEKDHF